MLRLFIRDYNVVGGVDVEHRHQVRAAILALAKVEIDATGVAEIPDRGPRLLVTAGLPFGGSEGRQAKKIHKQLPK